MQVGFNLSDDTNTELQHDPSFPYFEMCDAWLADAQYLAKDIGVMSLPSLASCSLLSGVGPQPRNRLHLNSHRPLIASLICTNLMMYFFHTRSFFT